MILGPIDILAIAKVLEDGAFLDCTEEVTDSSMGVIDNAFGPSADCVHVA